MSDNNANRIQMLERIKESCDEDDFLVKAVRFTRKNQRIILERESAEHPVIGRGSDAKIIVSGRTVLEAASAHQGKKVCILNPGCATFPGGDVAKGKSGFEEDLCRTSAFYKCIAYETCWKGFYLPHRRQPNPLHTDDIIYSPDVIVFKTMKEDPAVFQDKDNQFTIDILTCSPPEYRKPAEGSPDIIGKEELQSLLYKRCRKILQTASLMGAEVFILRDFGKGTYKSRTQLTAEAFRKALEETPGLFETVEFAMGPTDRSKTTYLTYQRVFYPNSSVLKMDNSHKEQDTVCEIREEEKL